MPKKWEVRAGHENRDQFGKLVKRAFKKTFEADNEDAARALAEADADFPADADNITVTKVVAHVDGSARVR